MAITATCDVCGFSSTDIALVQHHSCEIEQQGGRCEDYPCCGHEAGDCNGRKYGSDEKIIEDVYRASRDEEFAEAYDRQLEYDDYWSQYSN